MNHSLQQQKLFFALCKELDYDTVEAKERAKKKYGVEHLGKLSSKQMKELIDLMQSQLPSKAVNLNTNLEFRAWDKEKQTMLHEDDFINDYYFSMGFEGDILEIDISDMADKNRIDVMQFTGRKDFYNNKIFHFDIFIDRQHAKWMVDWSDQDLAWIAIDMSTDKKKMLSLFGAIKVIGNVYQGTRSVE